MRQWLLAFQREASAPRKQMKHIASQAAWTLSTVLERQPLGHPDKPTTK